MTDQNAYDGLIRRITASIFPACDWRLIKAQIAQESSFNPSAVSPCGAVGLMQLMPGTAWQIKRLSGDELFDPEKNVTAGVIYLGVQFLHLPEIPNKDERLKFALASYNGGRGYVNKALALAYQNEHKTSIPVGHKGAIPGNWQKWGHTKEMLMSPFCKVNGLNPDHRQMIEYVERIWKRYEEYKKA